MELTVSEPAEMADVSHSRGRELSLYQEMSASELKQMIKQRGLQITEPADKQLLAETLADASWERLNTSEPAGRG